MYILESNPINLKNNLIIVPFQESFQSISEHSQKIFFLETVFLEVQHSRLLTITVREKGVAMQSVLFEHRFLHYHFQKNIFSGTFMRWEFLGWDYLHKSAIDSSSSSKYTIFLRIELSIHVILKFILKNLQFETHSSRPFILQQKTLPLDMLWKQSFS